MLEDTNTTEQKVIDSAIASDLTINILDHSFLAHKKILSTRNSVFKSVIAALPTTYDLSSSISIPDFDPIIFKIFLKYIYTQIIDKKDISEDLLDVAHKYVDSKLLKICEDNLMLTTVSEESAIKLLISSTNVGNEKLQEKATTFIVERYAEMTKRDDFQKLEQNPEAMRAICGRFHSKFNIQKSA